MISIAILVPVIAAIIILILRDESTNAIRYRSAYITIAATFVSLVSATALQVFFVESYGSDQFKGNWSVTGNGVTNFPVAIDGLSQPLFLTTTFLFFVAALFSLNTFQLRSPEAKEPELGKLFWSMLLFLESTILGIFAARNYITFFIFWELFLVPIVILIWYFGLEDRRRAAMTFFIYTFVSSAFMIAAFTALVYYAPRVGADFDMKATLASEVHTMPYDKQVFLFLLFLIPFIVKMPVIPFHIWLPQTHTQAAPATLLLSGLLLKLGSYGILRFIEPNFSGVLVNLGATFIWLGLATMLYGGFAAYRQKSFRYVIAYSSLAHMGLIFAGSMSGNELAVSGAIIQNVGHSLANALLFVLVAMHLIRNKPDSFEEINPPASFVYWAAFALAIFSAIGVPGTVGFVGEFLMLLGLSYISWPMAIVGTLTLIMSATYMLRLFHKIRARPTDTSWRPTMLERACLILLSFAIIYLGVNPSFMAQGARSTSKVITAPVLGAKH